MGDWMAFKHEQQPCPANINGVPVKLEATGPDGQTIDIGTVTSNSYGVFACDWTPPGTGMYTITATFAGSDSYGSSSAATMLSVKAAPSPSPTTQPSGTSSTDMYLIAAFVVIIILVVVLAAMVLRKRK
jgi:hypothetical protein